MARLLNLLEISAEAQQHPDWELVCRVVASPCFRSSHRLRDFLLYVSDCALRDAPEEATEQHIGMHVFGRPPGFNSSEDSIVRTHARSLRQKLAEYFTAEGAREERIIEIPKGHYLPVFQVRAPAHLPDQLTPPPPPPAEAETAPTVGRRRFAAPLYAAAALLMVLAAAWLSLHSFSRPTSVDRFWAPFISGNNSLVIYSNALFIGNSATGMRYAAPEASPQPSLPAGYVDTYTGIGELTSVYDLTRLFDSHHASFTLKRSLLVTWDEAQMKNLIFLGSVAENSSIRVLPATMDFTLMAGNGMAGIVNHDPKPGELPLYGRPEHPLTRDYAIFALLPGLRPDRRMVLFSGLMTTGTQAAVEFACRRDSMDELLRRVGEQNGHIRPFQAVLETTLAEGVPIETHITALHVH